ncbi:uncharacterized protein I303_107278 [Kwoniella dejecticola CBS 10117]|uniref:Peptidase M20 domain-containing protein 2 n=1 Tax=Kwoniella dejecticola CBS 10117 TaxID=1296121 RepID=A0A1A5ZZ83_9TREE|nr:uncharacterized protein I303_06681 [Kwoniella dejecticola CBS 10117]OBR83122.1 hypothetical protein I303_06681 [Kwoniella dejecticola CBS 10117]
MSTQLKQVYETASKAIQAKQADLKDVSVFLSDNPEIANEEYQAHDKITAYLEKEGFEVTKAYKIPTAFRASYTNGVGGRTFGLNSEYDALPGIGHGCGHNLIAISGVAALLGMREAMKKHDIPGTVVLLGTPAEEIGTGKPALISAGAYKEMDACMMLHPGKVPIHNSAISAAFAHCAVVVEYFGKPAHAAALPWQGVNALDAAVAAYNGVATVRQQLEPDVRIHAIITNGGSAVNVIPEYTSSKYMIRSLSSVGVEKLKVKIEQVLKAAGMATGCEVKTTWQHVVKDLHHSEGLGDAYKEAMEELFPEHKVQCAYGVYVGGGSTDFGNVTYELPACHPHFGIVPQVGRGQHTAEFEQAARTDVAHKETYQAATGVAATGLRFLSDDIYAKDVNVDSAPHQRPLPNRSR